MTGSEIIEKLKVEKKNLQKQFGVKEIGVFGSVVHGDMDEDSDVDIIVSFKEVNLPSFGGLYVYLEKIFNRKVDIIHRSKYMPEKFMNTIKNEIIYV